MIPKRHKLTNGTKSDQNTKRKSPRREGKSVVIMDDVDLLSFNKCLLRSFSKKLETSTRQCDDLSFSIFVVLIVRFDWLVGDCLDHLNDIFRSANQLHKLLVFRFEQLKQSPDGNVLERWIAAGKETAQVSVDTTNWITPVPDEGSVVTDCI